MPRVLLSWDFIGFLALATGVVAFGLLSNNVYHIQVATTVGILATAAIGLNVVMGGAGQISLGQAGFMAIGAYTSAKLLTNDVPFELAFPLAGLATLPFGLAVGYSALRLRGNYLAFATLAFSGIIYGLLLQREEFGGARGIRAIPRYSFGEFVADEPIEQYVVVWVVVLAAYVLSVSLLRSRVGRALAALRDDELAATSLGINAQLFKVLAFAFSGFLGGLAGSLLASYQTAIVPARFDILESVMLLVIVAVGGLGSIPGSVLGALVLTVLQEFGRDWERYRLTGYGVLIIALMVFMPGGLISLPGELWRVFVRCSKNVASRLGRRRPRSDGDVAA